VPLDRQLGIAAGEVDADFAVRRLWFFEAMLLRVALEAIPIPPKS
jgi:hypothetical protein